MSQEVNYDLLSIVITSQYRKVVVEALADGPLTPSEIAETAGVEIAHVSRALQTIRDENGVELLVDEDRQKGRIYGLTDQGRKVADELDQR